MTGGHLVGETVEVTGESRFYGVIFEACHLIAGPDCAAARFLQCMLAGCTFEPPFVFGLPPGPWECLTMGSNVVMDEPR